ncbi:hypothetical protein L6164_007806 [Bauhinia variegata]|uniref:Uncharacterized protein n=1 Tax=Bauhinia variegata TaxID=167791 RepID=A0ACB9PG67_BAUVA|nr:hypothetical protein L6164_007806 [Bauhinia variegata]
MAKEGDLWDDSALINAFDRAISSYKVMHGNKTKDCTADKAEQREPLEIPKDIESSNELENPETRRDTDEKDNVPLTNAPDSGETSNVSSLEENQPVNSHAAHPYLDTTSNQNIQGTADAHSGYPDGQVADDYSQLVSQYYELEEKQQKILEQLNQYGGWNYQYPTDASNFGAPYSNLQQYSTPACQASHPNVLYSCCQCFSQCSLAPCASVPGCSLCGTCVGKTCKDDSVATGPERLGQDSQILKTAMGAAERAMSTIRTTISADSNMKEEKEIKHSELDRCTDSDTDLTELLNAWYSAGFYTGKYLAQQSMANRRQK